MFISGEKTWAGTESSLKSALDAEEGAAQRLAAGLAPTEDEEDQTPRLLEVQDGVAVISIRGPLNNEAGFWNELFGMTGYPEIRDALVTAAEDPTVQQIMLDIDSGGGAVSGCADTAKLISTINRTVKPVSTFTDGTMASAAYWLGCSAGDVIASKTALVGSIGVITTHMERSAQLKADGIGVTVIRAGKYKALANSVEPLGPEGKAQIQQVVDAAYQVFVEHVAEARSTSYENADQTMAQGREFIGEAALNVGLVDGIGTFDDLLGELKTKSIDASKKLMDNRGKIGLPIPGKASTEGALEMTIKRSLTAQDVAAIAAGAPVAAIAGTDPVLTEGVAPVVDAVGADVAAETAATTGTVAATQDADKTAMTVQFMTDQIKAKDEQILQAGIKTAKLEEQLADISAVHDSLMAIAIKSVNTMQVALGGSALDLKGMTAAAVLAEHGRLATQFANKFPVGGVAATDAESSVKQDLQVSPRHLAMVNAVRAQKK